MPLYEYQCKKCKHRFEKIQKFSDKPIRKCPECGSAVEKLLSAPATHFKGEGWYVTDYARKNATPATTSAESSSGDGAKPAAKEESSPKSGSKSESKSVSSSGSKAEPASKSNRSKQKR